MEPVPATARLLWRLIEPVHAVTYFAPEPISEFRNAGYRGFWMGYFAGRAAPLGPVGPELVHALFYNFAFDRVAKALPDAWMFAPPHVALEARERGATAALRRQLGDLARDPCVAVAADLLGRAAQAAPLEGRPLFAANRALPEPVDPIARLWHFATLLREHRGDGHVATLLSGGVTGRQSHVLQSLAMGMPKPVYVAARDFSDDEWSDVLAELQSAGYVDTAGYLTDSGRARKDDIEARTDELAWKRLRRPAAGRPRRARRRAATDRPRGRPSRRHPARRTHGPQPPRPGRLTDARRHRRGGSHRADPRRASPHPSVRTANDATALMDRPRTPHALASANKPSQRAREK